MNTYQRWDWYGSMSWRPYNLEVTWTLTSLLHFPTNAMHCTSSYSCGIAGIYSNLSNNILVSIYSLTVYWSFCLNKWSGVFDATDVHVLVPAWDHKVPSLSSAPHWYAASDNTAKLVLSFTFGESLLDWRLLQPFHIFIFYTVLNMSVNMHKCLNIFLTWQSVYDGYKHFSFFIYCTWNMCGHCSRLVAKALKWVMFMVISHTAPSLGEWSCHRNII